MLTSVFAYVISLTLVVSSMDISVTQEPERLKKVSRPGHSGDGDLEDCSSRPA
jgi:hypothetical protein